MGISEIRRKKKVTLTGETSLVGLFVNKKQKNKIVAPTDTSDRVDA